MNELKLIFISLIFTSTIFVYQNCSRSGFSTVNINTADSTAELSSQSHDSNEAPIPFSSAGDIVTVPNLTSQVNSTSTSNSTSVTNNVQSTINTLDNASQLAIVNDSARVGYVDTNRPTIDLIDSFRNGQDLTCDNSSAVLLVQMDVVGLKNNSPSLNGCYKIVDQGDKLIEDHCDSDPSKWPIINAQNGWQVSPQVNGHIHLSFVNTNLKNYSLGRYKFFILVKDNMGQSGLFPNASMIKKELSVKMSSSAYAKLMNMNSVAQQWAQQNVKSCGDKVPRLNLSIATTESDCSSTTSQLVGKISYALGSVSIRGCSQQLTTVSGEYLAPTAGSCTIVPGGAAFPNMINSPFIQSVGWSYISADDSYSFQRPTRELKPGQWVFGVGVDSENFDFVYLKITNLKNAQSNTCL